MHFSIYHSHKNPSANWLPPNKNEIAFPFFMHKNCTHPSIPHSRDYLLLFYSFILFFFFSLQIGRYSMLWNICFCYYYRAYKPLLKFYLDAFFPKQLGISLYSIFNLLFPQETMQFICNAGKEYSAFHSSHSFFKSTELPSNYFPGLSSVLFNLTLSQESCNSTLVLFLLFVVYSLVKMIVLWGTGRKGGN